MVKTKIFFSKNVSQALTNNISMNSGFKTTKDLEKYLGVPLLHQRVTKHTYKYIIDNLQSKLVGWKANSLSLAGKITLCKVVLSSIPLYPIQLALLLKIICYDIEKLCRRFIWGQNDGKDKIHLVNWRTMCQQKEVGGLGLRKMDGMNKAFIMKLALRVFQNSESLQVRVFRSKYVKEQELILYP